MDNDEPGGKINPCIGTHAYEKQLFAVRVEWAIRIFKRCRPERGWHRLHIRNVFHARRRAQSTSTSCAPAACMIMLSVVLCVSASQCLSIAVSQHFSVSMLVRVSQCLLLSVSLFFCVWVSPCPCASVPPCLCFIVSSCLCVFLLSCHCLKNIGMSSRSAPLTNVFRLHAWAQDAGRICHSFRVFHRCRLTRSRHGRTRTHFAQVILRAQRVRSVSSWVIPLSRVFAPAAVVAQSRPALAQHRGATCRDAGRRRWAR